MENGERLLERINGPILELQKPRLGVEEAGFCPYAVQGPEGQWMLYAGAFHQKSRAEKQNKELRAKGIQSRLVER